MSTLISLVGRQPGAIAATAKTLLKNHLLSSIMLLPSKQTESIAYRLESYLMSLDSNLAIKIITVNINSNDPADELSAWNCIIKLIESSDFSKPFYYDTSPGLNYQVAMISYYLKSRADIIPIYADNTSLYFLDNSRSLPLENIGIDELLSLHNLAIESTYSSSLGKSMPYTDIISANHSVRFLQMKEYHGRLHGVIDILCEKKDSTKQQKKENHRIKQEARNVSSVLKSAHHLNFLHPFIQVLTNNYHIRTRLNAHGVKVYFIDTELKDNNDKKKFLNQNIKNIWKNFNLQKDPGDIIPSDNIEVINFNKGYVAIPSTGKWNGKKLVVSLGVDPASTMLSIFTHNPSELIILVDEYTPIVKLIAERIKNQKHAIQSKMIYFWPVSLTGKIKHIDDFINKISDGKWAVNISPGSKAQAWQLARLPNVQLWSLNNFKKQSVSLIQQEKISYYNYSLPPIIVQATVQQSEPLYHDKTKENAVMRQINYYERKSYHGSSLQDILDKKDFLVKFANVVAKTTQTKDGYFPFFRKKWHKGMIFPENSKKHYLKCISVDLQKEEMKFEACHNKKSQEGIIKGVPDTGHWLEEAIASSFLQAGGNNVKDLRVGIKWPWVHQKEFSHHFRTEIDIVMIWKQSYICISCKMAAGKKFLDEVRSEIIAETRAGFGRFALPILVRGGIPKKISELHAIETIEAEPMEISLCLLNNTGAIHKLIERALSQKMSVK